MKKKIIFIFCCLGCLFIASCGKKCPGFPTHLVDYFPYREGDVFSFVNQHNDTLSFWVRESWVSKEHTLSYFNKCGNCCGSPNTSFVALRLISKSLAAELGIAHDKEVGGLVISSAVLSGGMQVIYDDSGQTTIRVEILDSYWDFDYTNALGLLEFSFYDESGKDPFDKKNDALFGETVIIEDELKQISSITIVKSKGITGFYDKKHDFKWKSIKK